MMTTTITTKEALWKEILQDPLNIDAWHMYADVLVQLNEDPITADLIYDDIEKKNYQFSPEINPYIDQRDIAGYIIQVRCRFSYYLADYHDQMNDIIRRHPTLKYIRIHNDATVERLAYQVRFRTPARDYHCHIPIHHTRLFSSSDNHILRYHLTKLFPQIWWEVI